MPDTRALGLLTREAFKSIFRVGDVIPFASHKNSGALTVVEFTERGIKVKSQRRASGYLLDFEKLGVVVESFASISPRGVHDAVGGVLKKRGLPETSTETILYAAAKEFLARSAVPTPPASSPRGTAAVTEALNELVEHVNTKPDTFSSTAAAELLASVEW